MLFGDLVRMDESADARIILTAVQFLRVIGKGRQDVLTPPGSPLWRTDLSYHNHSVEDATEMALDRPLWRLLAAPTYSARTIFSQCHAAPQITVILLELWRYTNYITYLLTYLASGAKPWIGASQTMMMMMMMMMMKMMVSCRGFEVFFNA